MTTENGHPMPVDPTPTDSGIVFVAYLNGRLVGRVQRKGQPSPPGVRYMPHHATCTVLNAHTLASRPSRPPVPPAVPQANLFGDNT